MSSDCLLYCPVLNSVYYTLLFDVSVLQIVSASLSPFCALYVHHRCKVTDVISMTESNHVLFDVICGLLKVQP